MGWGTILTGALQGTPLIVEGAGYSTLCLHMGKITQKHIIGSDGDILDVKKGMLMFLAIWMCGPMI